MEKIKNKILTYFEDLTFEERSHSYKVRNKKLKKSVSKIVESFSKKADFTSISKKIDNKFNLPLGTTQNFWRLKSQIALLTGDKAHLFGELYMFNRSLVPGDGYERAVVAFWKSMPSFIIPVCAELQMYHKIHLFGATKDILLYNTRTKKFITGDYKTNGEPLTKNFAGKKLKAPFSNLLDCAYNKYQIQLSLYQIVFEQTGYEVEKRMLVHLKSDGTYDMFETDDLTKPLRKYLAA